MKGRPKDKSIKVQISVINKKEKPIYYSFRFKDITKEQAIQKSVEYLKKTL